ncbi:hypothetical protein AYL99_08220 [Fonsecaea erecta]|uniref:Uncharacterized protein n=1 Tax=Fonsecaea erecta TaxID=1367422 RepID=A0A178ZCU7_9EURO|nr:hypothetical protein AYL99_08220 [Fonsecaea erecta]OAP57482.1 hypothetical protein AYL99_08220 [Fonsecaea erecta]
MTGERRDMRMMEGTEEPPVTVMHHHNDLTKALLTTPNGLDDLPVFSVPRPDFLTVFSRVAPFADGLRESAILDRYDYTRLRMTCRTIAEVWKPYPYDRGRPDTKDRYFAGVQAIPCDDCGIPSDRLVVKPCHGMGPEKAGSFSGCEKLVCTYCVMFAQRSHASPMNVDNELHYCQPCSWHFFRRMQTRDPAEGRCRCALRSGGPVVEQPDSEWQCKDCRIALVEKLSCAARDNLMAMEARGQVFARDYTRHPFAGGVNRWIDHEHANRNHCPGCGINYIQLLQTWEDSNWDEIADWPCGMVRQCMTCLELKS